MRAPCITEPGPGSDTGGRTAGAGAGLDGRARRRQGIGGQPGRHLHPVRAIPDADVLPFVVGRDLVGTVTAVCPYLVQMTHILAYQSTGDEK